MIHQGLNAQSFNALPPLPPMSLIVNYVLDADKKPRVDGVHAQAGYACEIPAAWLDHYRWLLTVNSDGYLVVRAVNATLVYRVVGMNMDYQGALYLRLEWVDSLDADPPVVPEEVARGWVYQSAAAPSPRPISQADTDAIVTLLLQAERSILPTLERTGLILTAQALRQTLSEIISDRRYGIAVRLARLRGFTGEGLDA